MVVFECDVCGRTFSSQVGVKVHKIRGTQCFPMSAEERYRRYINYNNNAFQQPPPMPQQQRNTHPFPAPRMTAPELYVTPRTSTEVQPNLFFYTAIQDNRSQHSDDDFSIISNREVFRHRIPENILYTDENVPPPRENERQQRVVEYIQGLAEARREPAPLRQSICNWIFNRLFESINILHVLINHGLRWGTIYFFVMAVFYCHSGECTAYYNHFIANQDRVRQVLLNQ